MSEPKMSRSKWSAVEDDALRKAFNNTTTAEEFFKVFRGTMPAAPQRTVKAYLSRLCMAYPDKADRARPVYLDLNRANAVEEAAFRVEAEKQKLAKEASVPAVPATTPSSWVDDIDPVPSPPEVAPRPATAPNFVKPAPSGPVKPDPNARVPRHIPVPPASHGTFSPAVVTTLLGLPASSVERAVSSHKLPVRTVVHGADRERRDVITRPVFDILHAALCEGHSFDHACLLACEKYPAPTPIVTAENLYASDAQGEPAPDTAPLKGGEPDPNKVREGYLKGPFPIKRADDAASLDDPNPDAHGGFTVEEATRELGLTDTAVLLTAIHRDRFPAVKIDGKWTLTRADLKRIRALRDEGLTVEEAIKRAGAPTVDSPTVPNEGSWTDHIAPLTPEEKGEADGTMVSLEDVAGDLHIYAHDVYTVMDDYPTLVKVSEREAYISRAAFNLIQEKWRSCRSLREACDYAVEKLGLTPAKTDVSDERQWALEALGEGVFTVEQTLKIAGVTDNPRNRWALGLLGRGEINLAQAAKLLR